MADTRTYTGISASVFTCVKDSFQTRTIDIDSGNSGEILVHYPVPLKFHFDWDGSSTLALQITGKPASLPVSEDNVWELIDKSVLPCGGTVS